MKPPPKPIQSSELVILPLYKQTNLFQTKAYNQKTDKVVLQKRSHSMISNGQNLSKENLFIKQQVENNTFNNLVSLKLKQQDSIQDYYMNQQLLVIKYIQEQDQEHKQTIKNKIQLQYNSFYKQILDKFDINIQQSVQEFSSDQLDYSEISDIQKYAVTIKESLIQFLVYNLKISHEQYVYNYISIPNNLVQLLKEQKVLQNVSCEEIQQLIDIKSDLYEKCQHKVIHDILIKVIDKSLNLVKLKTLDQNSLKNTAKLCQTLIQSQSTYLVTIMQQMIDTLPLQKVNQLKIYTTKDRIIKNIAVIMNISNPYDLLVAYDTLKNNTELINILNAQTEPNAFKFYSNDIYSENLSSSQVPPHKSKRKKQFPNLITKININYSDEQLENQQISKLNSLLSKEPDLNNTNESNSLEGYKSQTENINNIDDEQLINDTTESAFSSEPSIELDQNTEMTASNIQPIKSTLDQVHQEEESDQLEIPFQFIINTNFTVKTGYSTALSKLYLKYKQTGEGKEKIAQNKQKRKQQIEEEYAEIAQRYSQYKSKAIDGLIQQMCQFEVEQSNEKCNLQYFVGKQYYQLLTDMLIPDILHSEHAYNALQLVIDNQKQNNALEDFTNLQKVEFSYKQAINNGNKEQINNLFTEFRKRVVLKLVGEEQIQQTVTYLKNLIIDESKQMSEFLLTVQNALKEANKTAAANKIQAYLDQEKDVRHTVHKMKNDQQIAEVLFNYLKAKQKRMQQLISPTE
ncbi:Hypothetical_protein [Hexamita inflata]|uniref:Hypothetical_protein n=2 Tax=Hexamita inflata TaxID=28002 RepID=A0AA86RDT4_9EUKA|nr:Hypothetical protein HINF_LOCUS58912 [Hexamita inflata]